MRGMGRILRNRWRETVTLRLEGVTLPHQYSVAVAVVSNFPAAGIHYNNYPRKRDIAIAYEGGYSGEGNGEFRYFYVKIWHYLRHKLQRFFEYGKCTEEGALDKGGN